MNYDISRTWRGYEIRTTKNGRNIYLQSIYKGVAKWTCDYTYSRKYATEAAACKAIKAIKDA